MKENLETLLKKDNIIKVAGAYDGLSAKIIENVGFDAIWSSGLCISASYGVPDLSIITLNDILERAIIMKDTVEIPIIADCDSGFGNINNAIRTTKLFCKNGIDAICIEDKIFPKRNSYLNGNQELRTKKEFVDIIKACKDTSSQYRSFFIARIEGFISGCSIEEIIDRANSYIEAGADGLFIQSKKTDLSEVVLFMKNLDMRIPVFLVPTTYPNVTITELEKLNIKGVIYANQAMRSSIMAQTKTLERILNDGTSYNIENEISTIEDLFKLQNTSKYLKY